MRTDEWYFDRWCTTKRKVSNEVASTFSMDSLELPDRLLCADVLQRVLSVVLESKKIFR